MIIFTTALTTRHYNRCIFAKIRVEVKTWVFRHITTCVRSTFPPTIIIDYIAIRINVFHIICIYILLCIEFFVPIYLVNNDNNDKRIIIQLSNPWDAVECIHNFKFIYGYNIFKYTE